jgi:hypothetical protein
MTNKKTDIEGARWVSARQSRFIRYLLYVLVDLCVLTLFVEYWDRIVIDSFTISLLTAVLLQVLLKATLAVEHRIAGYFQARSEPGALVLRVLATWALIFGSKFVILDTVDIVFGRAGARGRRRGHAEKPTRWLTFGWAPAKGSTDVGTA